MNKYAIRLKNIRGLLEVISQKAKSKHHHAVFGVIYAVKCAVDNSCFNCNRIAVNSAYFSNDIYSRYRYEYEYEESFQIDKTLEALT